jgi:hypothetical protein
MAFDPVTAALELGKSVLDRVLPDKAANDAAKAALAQSAQSGDLQQMLGQLNINLVEAGAATGSKNGFVQFFIAGWRPAIGWLCGLGLLWEYWCAPLLGFFKPNIATPHINSGDLNTLLFAMLGLGVMRTVDKINGVGSGH